MHQTTSQFYLLFLFLPLSFLTACSDPAKKAPANTADPIATSKTCIEKIIAADEALGKTRNHACETIPLAETVRNYADGLEGLDYTDCPSAFSTSFKKHIAAWRGMIPYLENYSDLRGEMHDLFDQLEKGENANTFKPLQKAIWDTWGEIETAMNE